MCLWNSARSSLSSCLLWSSSTPVSVIYHILLMKAAHHFFSMVDVICPVRADSCLNETSNIIFSTSIEFEFSHRESIFFKGRVQHGFTYNPCLLLSFHSLERECAQLEMAHYSTGARTVSISLHIPGNMDRRQ